MRWGVDFDNEIHHLDDETSTQLKRQLKDVVGEKTFRSF